jgi:F-type H+-transporting ATPase subunit b
MRARRSAALAGALLAFGAGAARASDEGGAGGGLLFPLLNLALLLGVLFYFARKPIRDFFSERRGTIQAALEDAARMRAEAEARYAEWQRKLAALEAELDEIRTHSRERAEAERERILSDARAAAERIRGDARAAVQQEVERARRALREEAADLAVEIAAERLRGQVRDADRARLIDEFIERIETTERA